MTCSEKPPPSRRDARGLNDRLGMSSYHRAFHKSSARTKRSDTRLVQPREVHAGKAGDVAVVGGLPGQASRSGSGRPLMLNPVVDLSFEPQVLALDELAGWKLAGADEFVDLGVFEADLLFESREG